MFFLDWWRHRSGCVPSQYNRSILFFQCKAQSIDPLCSQVSLWCGLFRAFADSALQEKFSSDIADISHLRFARPHYVNATSLLRILFAIKHYFFPWSCSLVNGIYIQAPHRPHMRETRLFCFLVVNGSFPDGPSSRSTMFEMSVLILQMNLCSFLYPTLVVLRPYFTVPKMIVIQKFYCIVVSPGFGKKLRRISVFSLITHFYLILIFILF